jgi:hypothetical protein
MAQVCRWRHHCDVKTTLEIILISLLESLEYLRHRAVREAIDGCERDIAANRLEERIIFHKEYISRQNYLFLELY